MPRSRESLLRRSERHSGGFRRWLGTALCSGEELHGTHDIGLPVQPGGSDRMSKPARGGTVHSLALIPPVTERSVPADRDRERQGRGLGHRAPAGTVTGAAGSGGDGQGQDRSAPTARAGVARLARTA